MFCNGVFGRHHSLDTDDLIDLTFFEYHIAQV
jgi:hypothetical protein